ncbi:MAG: hypothetical protein RMA76_04160 [Deltaproteobacteria bacterium]|jgi:hypothetical protein
MNKHSARTVASSLLLAFLAGCGGCAEKKTEPAPAKKEAAMKAPEPKKEAPEKKAPPKKSPEEIKAIRNKVDEDGIVRRGDKLSAKEQVSVAIAFSKASEIDGQPMKITGKVTEASSNGCSFKIAEGSQAIKVAAPSCKILVPDFSEGMWATVEGKVSVKETEKDGKTERTVSLSATGLELRKM